MQILCLNETFRIIGYSLLSNDVNFVEMLGLSGYDVKPHFCSFHCESLLQNPHYL